MCINLLYQQRFQDEHFLPIRAVQHQLQLSLH